MHIIKRKDGSSRIFTRNHALHPDGAHRQRRKTFVAGTALALVAMGGTAFAFLVGEGSGTGTSHATIATPSAVSLSVGDAGSIQMGATNTANYPLTPCALPSAGAATAAACEAGNSPDSIWVVWAVQATKPFIVQSAVPSLNTDGSGNVINNANGNPVVGCRASWFLTKGLLESITTSDGGNTFADGGPNTLPFSANAGQYYFGTDLVFADSGGNQNACAGVTPRLTLTLS